MIPGSNGYEILNGQYLRCLICGTVVANYDDIFIIPGSGEYNEWYGISYRRIINIYEAEDELLCVTCSNSLGINCDGSYVFDKTKVVISD